MSDMSWKPYIKPENRIPESVRELAAELKRNPRRRFEVTGAPGDLARQLDMILTHGRERVSRRPWEDEFHVWEEDDGTVVAWFQPGEHKHATSSGGPVR